MRAARLLQMLLLLQQNGRLTSAFLANELEVSPRTIWRDLDALTEAGIPVIAHRGNTGGISLAFNFRTRLTGLGREEARALSLMLARSNPAAEQLGLGPALASLKLKLLESLPAQIKEDVGNFEHCVKLRAGPEKRADLRLTTLLYALDHDYRISARHRRDHRVETIDFRPVRIELGGRSRFLVIEANGQERRVEIDRLDELTLSYSKI